MTALPLGTQGKTETLASRIDIGHGPIQSYMENSGALQPVLDLHQNCRAGMPTSSLQTSEHVEPPSQIAMSSTQMNTMADELDELIITGKLELEYEKSCRSWVHTLLINLKLDHSAAQRVQTIMDYVTCVPPPKFPKQKPADPNHSCCD